MVKIGNQNAKKDIAADKWIQIRVTQMQKDRFKALAKSQNCSLSELVISLLEEKITV
jgi:hypothetical protein